MRIFKIHLYMIKLKELYVRFQVFQEKKSSIQQIIQIMFQVKKDCRRRILKNLKKKQLNRAALFEMEKGYSTANDAKGL